ncbi:MAG: DUF2358 domain-containing protein [Cyanobacteria bacterium J06635_15]
MDILERIKADYARFPADQSYELYAPDVYFKDPLNEFRGVNRYRQMIGVMGQWLKQIELELYSIERSQPDTLTTRWQLSWVAPLPWQPKMAIPGRSELKLNEQGLICSHIDYWDCSRLDVLKQLF